MASCCIRLLSGPWAAQVCGQVTADGDCCCQREEREMQCGAQKQHCVSEDTVCSSGRGCSSKGTRAPLPLVLPSGQDCSQCAAGKKHGQAREQMYPKLQQRNALEEEEKK